MIDLHMHTNFSDGSCSLEELICLLKENDVRYAALTDHDCVKGVEQFIKLANKNGINALAGVEITSDIEGDMIHILGYDFDIKNSRLTEALEKQSSSRLNRAKEMIQKANEKGLNITFEETINIAGNTDGDIGKPHLAKALIKNNREKLKEILGEELTIGLVINELFDDGKLLFVGKDNISYDKAIKLLKEAGGYTVLAHPNFKMSHEKLLHNLPKIVEAGLSGMECFFSASSEEETKKYLELAKKYNLITTAGSDFHGTDSRKLGKINFYNFDKGVIVDSLKKSFFSKVKKGGVVV